MSDTFQVFKDKVKQLVHPGGMASTLEFQFRTDILQSLIDIQRFNSYFQKRNRDLHPACSTYFACGATVVDKPRGELQRLYTLESDCCPVFLTHIPDYDEFVNWLNANRKAWTEPENEGMPPLPKPFKFYESSLTKGQRYNWGRYTFKNDQIWIGQRIEPTETVVAEWMGIRRNYEDDTLMPYDSPEGDEQDMGVELLTAVASYVRSEDLRKNRRALDDAAAEKIVYNGLVADMKHDTWKSLVPKHIGSNPDGILKNDPLKVSGDCAATECAAVDTENQTIVFANIADWGGNTTPEADVAEMVLGWAPSYITTNGDNWYGSSLEPSNFESWALELYRNYITPYISFQDPKLTSTAIINRFFPTIGNHDRDPVGRLATVLAMCNIPKVNRGGLLVASTGYYSARPLNGFVEHFFFDSGYDNSFVNQQADGNDLLSIQAIWLQTALVASTARWKIVHMHHTGYTSDVNPSGNSAYVGDGTNSFAAIRRIINKLQLWGADLVFTGHVHSYERLDVMGLPVIVNGAGGLTLDTLGTPVPFSEEIYDENYGACKISCTCTQLVSDFYSRDGVLRDTLTLTKPSGGAP